MKKIVLLIIGTAFLSCKQVSNEVSSASFDNDLKELQEYFHIPGMAAIVAKKGKVIYERYSGYADIETKRSVDSATVFPINSITKTYAAVLLKQLEESGDLDLNESINNYLQDFNLSDGIKVKHFLSHTSEVVPGSFYNYSGYRYHFLVDVLEQASGKPYKVLLKEKILDPLHLSSTYLPIDQSDLESLASIIAQPYQFTDKIEAGRYEAYKSASSGLVATARDLMRFDNALNSGKLISEKSMSEMFSSFPTTNGKSPYGLGVFTQMFLGKQLIWGYGQGEYSSSLILKVPEDEITVVLLANNNQMSDPPRLLNGNVAYSLFALSFLKHYVFDLPKKIHWRSLDQHELEDVLTERTYCDFYRQELLAHALAALNAGMVYGDRTQVVKCKELVRMVLKNCPDYESYGDQQLIFLLSILVIHADFDEVGVVLENLGEGLLKENPFDPYTNIYMGDYYNHKNEKERAMEYYKSIADVNNYSARAWFWVEALYYAGVYYREENPELAKLYFQKIVDIGWNLSGLRERAIEELEDL